MQPAPSTPDPANPPPCAPPAAGEFGSFTLKLLWTGRAVVVLAGLVLLRYFFEIATFLNSPGREGSALQIDFTAFWGAAKLGLAGEAIAAFDWRALRAAEDIAATSDAPIYFWLYPPGFHILVLPLGLLSFTLAFMLFTGFGVAAWFLALRRWTYSVPAAGKLALVAPAVGFTVLVGNTSLLWSAGLLAALLCILRDRPLKAGGFVALLTLKPQLGLLIPVALIAGRQWRTLFAATAGAALIALVGLAAFGADYWRAFFAALAQRSTTALDDLRITETMVTWYAFARQTGASYEFALGLQAGFLLLATVATGWLWRNRETSFDLKAAALCLATLVSTPYAFQYELVLALAAAIFLARAGLGRTVSGRAWLAALWLLPVPGWIVPDLHLSYYAAPAISLSVALCVLLRARRCQAALA